MFVWQGQALPYSKSTEARSHSSLLDKDINWNAIEKDPTDDQGFPKMSGNLGFDVRKARQLKLG
jgi:hypothetical protein